MFYVFKQLLRLWLDLLLIKELLNLLLVSNCQLLCIWPIDFLAECFKNHNLQDSVLWFPETWGPYKEFKRGNRVSFWPVLILCGSGHIAHHVWRWVIVPSDLAPSFCAICTHYHYRVIHHVITYMGAWFESTRERQLTLNKNYLPGLATKKSGDTITHLHTWQQDGRRNRFPL